MTKKLKDVEIIPTIIYNYYVSGITSKNMRWGDSDLKFDSIAYARIFIKGKKGLQYAKAHGLVQYRISRVIEISDDDIEIHQIPKEDLQ